MSGSVEVRRKTMTPVEDPLEKAYSQLEEDIQIRREEVTLVREGKPLQIFDRKRERKSSMSLSPGGDQAENFLPHNRVWVVHTFLFKLRDPNTEVRLDWEHDRAEWVSLHDPVIPTGRGGGQDLAVIPCFWDALDAIVLPKVAENGVRLLAEEQSIGASDLALTTIRILADTARELGGGGRLGQGRRRRGRGPRPGSKPPLPHNEEKNPDRREDMPSVQGGRRRKATGDRLRTTAWHLAHARPSSMSPTGVIAHAAALFMKELHSIVETEARDERDERRGRAGLDRGRTEGRRRVSRGNKGDVEGEGSTMTELLLDDAVIAEAVSNCIDILSGDLAKLVRHGARAVSCLLLQLAGVNDTNLKGEGSAPGFSSWAPSSGTSLGRLSPGIKPLPSLEPPEMWVMTCGCSSTVLAVLLGLVGKVEGKLVIRVLATESQPKNEGVMLLSRLDEGLEAMGLRKATRLTLLADSQAGLFAGRCSLVLLGADAVWADGSPVNKVGAYPVALAAARAGVALWVAATTSKAESLPPEGDECYFRLDPMASLEGARNVPGNGSRGMGWRRNESGSILGKVKDRRGKGMRDDGRVNGVTGKEMNLDDKVMATVSMRGPRLATPPDGMHVRNMHHERVSADLIEAFITEEGVLAAGSAWSETGTGDTSPAQRVFAEHAARVYDALVMTPTFGCPLNDYSPSPSRTAPLSRARSPPPQKKVDEWRNGTTSVGETKEPQSEERHRRWRGRRRRRRRIDVDEDTTSMHSAPPLRSGVSNSRNVGTATGKRQGFTAWLRQSIS